MKWESIQKAYPDDAAGVQLARKIYELVQESMKAIDIPRLDSLNQVEGSMMQLPFSSLAKVCLHIWKQSFEEEPAIDMEQALASFIKDETLAEIPEETRDAAAMVIRPVVTSYMSTLRELNQDLVSSAWNSGTCPFCNAYPRIALDSETSRKLSCLLCGQDWDFPRIKCPYCGNNDHETLGYFEAEEIEGVRVYYCDKCKHYIKVIDTRERAVQDTETEDVITLVMDELARQEGYL
ncbi:MAG TPA: formate dehydrogenase accessory protein FdhE [Deltaproteobacteria bacterium]|nr:formate dehydrogenase accessory protein FdhE [Deltaproteobacteria bacterium]